MLASAGADFLACETIPVLEEARAYVELLARHPASQAWLSFTSPDGVHTSHGEPLVACARLIDPVPNVFAVGVNCVKPEIVGDAIRALDADIRRAYQKTIAGSRSIMYHFKIYTIETSLQIALVRGRYEIVQTFRKGGEATLNGDIQWDLTREDGVLKIREVNYGRER